MTDRQILVDQLVRHEGLRLKVYTDSVGVPTIGIGRNLRDVGISEQEAMLLLDHDLDAVITDLSTFAWFASLDAVRQRAVADLRFNVGPSSFRGFPKFIHAMATGNYLEAANELRTSRWSGQVGHRAVELIDMIATGTE